jgi:hypothetical protein
MTRRDAIAELIAKVEAGNAWPMGRAADAYDVGIIGRHWSYAFNAFNGSLDAAKALHEAVLGDGYVSDGYKWCMWGSGKVSVWHVIKGWHHVGDVPDPSHHATSPARAWLLAILRALHAQEQA